MDQSNMKLHVFCCSTSLEPCDLQDVEADLPNTLLTVIGLPCSGKVDVPYLMKAFESGAAGVMVVTCRKEECHYIQGSFRAENRTHSVNTLLEEIGLGQGRITAASMDSQGLDGIITKLKTFRQSLQPLPNMTASNC